MASYEAPESPTLIVVGGLGTMADSHPDNGGGAIKDVWDDGSPSDFIDTNGGPITNVVCTWTEVGGVLTGAGVGTGVTVGTLCHVTSGDGANLAAGIYEVMSVPGTGSITIDNAGSDGDDINVTVRVGGALKSTTVKESLQDALDNAVNSTFHSPESRWIYLNLDHSGANAITDTIRVDTYTGLANDHQIIVGVNALLVEDGTRPVITTDADLANGLLEFFNGVEYTEWHNLDFQGGGKGANKAQFCVNDSVSQTLSRNHTLSNCIFQGAAQDGLLFSSNSWIIVNCEAKDNGDNGIYNRANRNARITACNVHDNDEHGIQAGGGSDAVYSGNVISNNGLNGLHIASNGDESHISNNTSFGNVIGFFIDDVADFCTILNNTSVGNTWGYDLQGKTQQPLGFFGYNHASDNSSGHVKDFNGTSDITNDEEFQTFRHGNNRTGDPLFTGAEDFRPLSGSDLIGNGLDAQESGNQDIGAIQGSDGGAFTEIIPDSRMRYIGRAIFIEN